MLVQVPPGRSSTPRHARMDRPEMRRLTLGQPRRPPRQSVYMTICKLFLAHWPSAQRPTVSAWWTRGFSEPRPSPAPPPIPLSPPAICPLDHLPRSLHSPSVPCARCCLLRGADNTGAGASSILDPLVSLAFSHRLHVH